MWNLLMSFNIQVQIYHNMWKKGNSGKQSMFVPCRFAHQCKHFSPNGTFEAFIVLLSFPNLTTRYHLPFIIACVLVFQFTCRLFSQEVKLQMNVSGVFQLIYVVILRSVLTGFHGLDNQFLKTLPQAKTFFIIN